MGLKAAVQALKKAEELKAKVSRHNDLLNNSEVWSDHQQLQTVYHQVLVLDLEYALDKKVEQELWTLGFKNHIAALQHLSRDKKNPRRSECQALLSWCLEAASGFYLTLLQELCSAFELDLPFRRRGAVYGQKWSNSEQLTQPHKSSCLYICQYCLVHLGDIARYRSQRKQAESFYRHAILLSPSSGQPYNQLALLEASRGDKLATVFHYVRSIAVKHPFPAAATNLNNTLSSIIDTEDSLTEIHSKLSLQDYVTLFLHVHGLLHTASDLQQASLGIKSLNATLTALVATKTFNSSKLTQMTAINLYALRHATDTGTKNNKNLSEDETKIKNLTLDLLAGAFSAYLLPIYTMSSDTSLLEYCALPAIKLTMDWIKTDSKVLKDSVFTKRLQIWPSLCKLLNSLQTIVGDFDNKNTEKIPLPEDRDMQCFLPLVNAFKDLDFTSENLNQDISFYNKLRVQRLVNLGLWLSTQTVDNNILITAKKIKNPNSVIFEPATKQPDPTTELLEELKHFNVKENAPLLNKEPKKSPNKSGEKRSGILKPQGSLEKSREEREQALLLAAEVSENGSTASLSNSSVTSVRSDTSSKLKRRQNVAMQALAKKIEENNKQVKFLTEPLNKIKEKTITKQPEIPKPVNKEVIQNIEPIRMPQSIVPPLELPKTNTNPIPMPYNQQNFPRSVPPYFQNNQNIPFHNSLPPQPQNIGNIPFQRPQNNPFSTPTNLSNQLPLQPPQNQPFNVPFELPNPPSQQPQPVGYQPSKDFPQYSPWLRDEKLPLPPSNWWTNNQKNLPRTFSNQAQNDPFSNFSFNTNSNQGFMPENLGYDRQFTPSSAFNNMNVWNSGSIQPNLMLMNQQQSMISAPNQQNVFGEMNKVNIPPRENIPTMNIRETSEPQNNSPVPGYSLFNSNWAPNLAVHGALKSSQPDRAPLMRQQSLFSGPGPSPLERLLQQQKQLRGPNKEDT